MGRVIILLMCIFAVSCRTGETVRKDNVITVSISPFAFFVNSIGGDDFTVNVMVPAGSDPHVYEPTPARVLALRNSAAYISNGFLDFELTWFDRFLSVNKDMKLLRLADSADLLKVDDHGHGIEADPHFWLSPSEALKMASSIRTFLSTLNPGMSARYESNYRILADSINAIHEKARELLSSFSGSKIFVFHPTLGYIARDYGLMQVAIEQEGKEPSPSLLKEIIEDVKASRAGVIFVQREYDRKHAAEVAAETGSAIVEINTLTANWFDDVNEIIEQIHSALVKR